MRKLILTLFAAVALVGCHNEPTPVAPDTPRAIAFDNVTTRAGLSDLQTDGFGVWAVINNTTVQNFMLMDNQHVEYDETDGWYYSPMQYWIDNTKFNFTATYPYDSNASYFSYNTEKYIFYFHGATAGRKYELAKLNPKVGFEIDGKYSLVTGDIACDYTAYYQSVIGNGILSIVENTEEKILALNSIMYQTTKKSEWSYSSKMLDAVAIFKLEVEKISCKVNKKD